VVVQALLPSHVLAQDAPDPRKKGGSPAFTIIFAASNTTPGGSEVKPLEKLVSDPNFHNSEKWESDPNFSDVRFRSAGQLWSLWFY
jgi:hypothetical protein